MKLNKITILLLLLTSFAFAQVDRSKMPEPGPAPKIELGNYQSFQLDNGLKVIVVENHKVPKVTFRLIINRDPILEGKNAGYIELSGELLRTGTQTKTKDEIDEAVDFIGATLNTSSTGVTASALTQYTDKILSIMSDIVLHPKFQQKELDKLKKQIISSLQAAKNDPSSIAENVRKALYYGKDHPYGEIMTEQTVKNITLKMCRDYYNTYFKPNISYLAVVGDITPEKAKEYAEKYFGSWQKGDVPHLKYKTPKAPLITKVALVDRPSAVQSVVHIGYPIKLPKNSPDVIPATVMNNILGGNFSSMLNLSLREKHAFTYGAHSRIASDKLVGLFDASWEARNPVTDSSITAALKEMKKIRTEKISEDELNSVKEYMTGSFARALENPETIANFALNIERYNLPKDYYQNYLKNLNAVTVADVQRMARQYVKPNNAYILVVGNAAEVAKKLKKFSLIGKVNYYDTYGNKYNPSLKKLPKGITAQTVLDNYVKAIGGKDKLLSIKDKTTKMSGEVQGMKISMTISQKEPNKYYQFMDAGVFQQKTVFDGNKGYSEAMGQRKAIEGDKLKMMKMQADIHSIINYDKYGIKVKLTGLEKVNNEDAYKMELETPWNTKMTQYFSVKTGLLLKQTTPISTPQGAFTQTINFSDYRDVNGLKFPFKIEQQMGPQSITLKVDSIELNKGLSDDLFKAD